MNKWFDDKVNNAARAENTKAFGAVWHYDTLGSQRISLFA